MNHNLLFNPAFYDYELPSSAIAQAPLVPRDQARLLVLDRKRQKITDAYIQDLPSFLNSGDLMVMNNTKVIAARLKGRRAVSGGRVEVFLTRKIDQDPHSASWEALLKPAKKLKNGAQIQFSASGAPTKILMSATIIAKKDHGIGVLRFQTEPPSTGQQVSAVVAHLGQVPLPPYITQNLRDSDQYQTIYARQEGAVAAPTAGLHFTPQLLARLDRQKTARAEITLHDGPGTFRPLDTDDVRGQALHPEHFQVTPTTADQLNQARQTDRRIVAIGTTSTRVLESVTPPDAQGAIQATTGITSIFLYPGYHFRATQALMTNFHLPKTSLLLLVCAFVADKNPAQAPTTEDCLAARSLVLEAYQHALHHGYRFYSFGDAMLII